MTGEPHLFVEAAYKGKIVPVLISECDVPIWVAGKWAILYHGGKPSAVMQTKMGPKKSEYFHRLVMDCPKGMTVDHINGDPLDNRRENLRICSMNDNALNKGKHYLPSKGGKKHGYKKSQYKGVWFDHEGWNARITLYGHSRFLGRFKSEIEAARAYNAVARELHGKYARLNDV